METDPRLASAMRDFGALMQAWSQVLPQPVRLTPAELLRSPRPHPCDPLVSKNGTARLLRCTDGWLALNLPRESDLALIPALIGDTCDPDTGWDALIAHARGQAVADLHAMACLLGLAVARPAEAAPAAPLPLPQTPLRRAATPPLVLDLSALWAGPLCGALLARGGCEVIKVEFTSRPDTTALSDPALHLRLNGAKHALRLDLQTPEERAVFHDLLQRAGLLITSARPAALAALIGDWHPDRPWIAICGHESDRQRIGFGDDCAIAGGLMAGEPEAPRFTGDAIADPLTGIYAALRACQALASGQGGLMAVSLSAVAARVAAAGLVA